LIPNFIKIGIRFFNSNQFVFLGKVVLSFEKQAVLEKETHVVTLGTFRAVQGNLDIRKRRSKTVENSLQKGKQEDWIRDFLENVLQVDGMKVMRWKGTWYVVFPKHLQIVVRIHCPHACSHDHRLRQVERFPKLLVTKKSKSMHVSCSKEKKEQKCQVKLQQND
jgi:hypothetical protein